MSKVNNNFLFLLVLVWSFFVFSYPLFTSGKAVQTLQRPETYGCGSQDLSGNIDYSQTKAIFEGERVNIPKLAYDINGTQVLEVLSEKRWIEVDLSDQKLFAWDGDALFLETPISSGLLHTPTPIGEFRIWTKFRSTKMEGGEGKYYYYLPNVPYVMYFGNDSASPALTYGLHGTYWHSDFGKPRSHGCIDLPITVAKELYFWVNPAIQDGKWMTKADEGNPGTWVVIHE